MAASLIFPIRAVVTKNSFQEPHRSRVIRRLSRLRGISTVVAPPAAALATTFVEPRVGIVGYIALCALAAILVSYLQRQCPSPPAREREPVRRHVLHEFRLHGRLLCLLASTVFTVITFDLIYPVYLRDTQSGGLVTFSLLLTAFGVGAVAGTFLRRAHEQFTWMVLISSLIPLGLLLQLPNSVHQLIFLMSAAMLVGISNAALGIGINVRIQKRETFSSDTAVAMGMAASMGQLGAMKTERGKKLLVIVLLQFSRAGSRRHTLGYVPNLAWFRFVASFLRTAFPEQSLVSLITLGREPSIHQAPLGNVEQIYPHLNSSTTVVVQSLTSRRAEDDTEARFSRLDPMRRRHFSGGNP